MIFDRVQWSGRSSLWIDRILLYETLWQASSSCGVGMNESQVQTIFSSQVGMEVDKNMGIQAIKRVSIHQNLPDICERMFFSRILKLHYSWEVLLFSLEGSNDIPLLWEFAVFHTLIRVYSQILHAFQGPQIHKPSISNPLKFCSHHRLTEITWTSWSDKFSTDIRRRSALQHRSSFEPLHCTGVWFRVSKIWTPTNMSHLSGHNPALGVYR